jgi:transketolase
MSLRHKILETSYKAKACHIGSALSCVEILDAIYETKKTYKEGSQEDVFIFAKASGVAAVYCRQCPDRAVDYLRKFPLPTAGKAGLIWSGGSLGQGLSVASGLAYADRSRDVYVLLSDGELQEGQTWEALMFAAHHQLPLKVIVDRNGLQALGSTESISSLEPLQAKFKAFGWNTLTCDGHSVKSLKKALKGKTPLIVIAKTVKGKGVPFMENNYEWHYKNLTEEGYAEALLSMDIEEGS